MNTTCLCDAPAPLAFAGAEKQSTSLPNQVLLAKDGLWNSGDKHAGVSIQVIEGSVWVTKEGDQCDYVVREGQTFRSVGGNRIVAQSLSARVRMVVQK